jgi:hypothetical protein
LGESARFFGAIPMKRRARFWGRLRQAGPDVRLRAHIGRSARMVRSSEADIAI